LLAPTARFRVERVTETLRAVRHASFVPAAAPRYPERLLALIEAIEDETLSLAEVARQVGAAAERAGITRPSVVHVRAIVAELRERRRDERELRQATVDALVDFGFGRSPNPWAIVERRDVARERIQERARRR
jgi:uncharacterized protein YjiS (DUF1127 family)